MRRIQVDLDRVDCDPDGVGVGRSLGWGREAVETLRMRADILNSSDRVLLKMYLEGGSKASEIARLAGVSETTVGRRIRRLIKRLMDGRYVTCVRNRKKLSRLDLGVARDRFIEGLSLPQMAAKRGTNIYQVRKSLAKIRGVLAKSEG